MSTEPRPYLTDYQDTRIAEYRAVSSSAVAGLILGLLSPAAMIDPVLWTAPIAGIIFSVLGLRRIARNAPALISRKAAMWGLILSIFFGSAAVTDWYVYRAMLRRQAAVPATAKHHTAVQVQGLGKYLTPSMPSKSLSCVHKTAL